MMKQVFLIILTMITYCSNAQSIVHRYKMNATITYVEGQTKRDTVYETAFLDVDLRTSTATLTLSYTQLKFYVLQFGNDTIGDHKITGYNLSSTVYETILIDPIDNIMIFVPVTPNTKNAPVIVFYDIQVWDDRFGWIRVENK
jgi:hypothetical protein